MQTQYEEVVLQLLQEHHPLFTSFSSLYQENNGCFIVLDEQRNTEGESIYYTCFLYVKERGGEKYLAVKLVLLNSPTPSYIGNRMKLQNCYSLVEEIEYLECYVNDQHILPLQYCKYSTDKRKVIDILTNKEEGLKRMVPA